MEEDNAASAKLTASLTDEAVLKTLRNRNDEEDEKKLVGAFMRGEHWLRNDGLEQHKELDREERLRLESKDILAESSVMKEDFQAMHIGTVELPPDSEEQQIAAVEQDEYIEKISSRMEIFNNYKFLTNENIQLNNRVSKVSEL